MGKIKLNQKAADYVRFRLSLPITISIIIPAILISIFFLFSIWAYNKVPRGFSGIGFIFIIIFYESFILIRYFNQPKEKQSKEMTYEKFMFSSWGNVVFLLSGYGILVLVILIWLFHLKDIRVLYIAFGLFLFLVSLSILAYADHRIRMKKKMKLEKEIESLKSPEFKAKRIYKYVCSRCLYQTNKKLKKCPECGKGTMKETA